MADYITIPRGEHRALLRDVRRGLEVCGEVARLRLTLRALDVSSEAMERAIKSCEDVGRLRVELVSLERRLLESDQDLTPVRPPSREDIKAAFDNANDFADGKKKPTR